MNKRIMFVEDDAVVRNNYAELLSDEGFDIEAFADQQSALDRANQELPDLALLDISLHHERDAGFQLCSDLRRLSKKLPILFFTSHDSEVDKISGIRLGADGYITKDVSIDYLVTRMEAMLRRCAELSTCDPYHCENSSASEVLALGPLSIDMDRLAAHWRGEKVELSLIQMRIVYDLAVQPGRVRSYSQLMRAADIFVEPNTVTSHIRAVRGAFKAIDPEFGQIKSERGAGYRWVAD